MTLACRAVAEAIADGLICLGINGAGGVGATEGCFNGLVDMGGCYHGGFSIRAVACNTSKVCRTLGVFNVVARGCSVGIHIHMAATAVHSCGAPSGGGGGVCGRDSANAGLAGTVAVAGAAGTEAVASSAIPLRVGRACAIAAEGKLYYLVDVGRRSNNAFCIAVMASGAGNGLGLSMFHMVAGGRGTDVHIQVAAAATENGAAPCG